MWDQGKKNLDHGGKEHRQRGCNMVDQIKAALDLLARDPKTGHIDLFFILQPSLISPLPGQSKTSIKGLRAFFVSCGQGKGYKDRRADMNCPPKRGRLSKTILSASPSDNRSPIASRCFLETHKTSAQNAQTA